MKETQWCSAFQRMTGRKQQQRDEPAEIKPGRDQPVPQFGNGDQPDQDRRPEEQRGVFRQQRATGGGADRQPPHAVAGLQHLGERKQQEAGRHQERRVRRDDHGADRGHQRDVEKDRRRRGHAPAAEQDGGGLIDRPAHRQRQQDRKQPHAELAIACDQRAEPDHHRDHRRMIVIAAGKMLRPRPVIGFVEGDRRERRGNQAQRHQPQDRQTRVEGNPRLVRIHFGARPPPVIPAKAGIQYAGKPAINPIGGGVLGRPVKPGDDSGV